MTENLINAKVVDRREDGTDVVVLHLAAEDGAILPAFTAGAHIDLHLPNGLIRQYSLCDQPGAFDNYRIGVLRDPASRGGSTAVHALKPGDQISISAPRNHFPLVEDSQDIVLLAGGIGITPILSMAQDMASLDRAFTMHYCARSPDRMAFRAELLRSPFIDRVQMHFDDGAADQRLNIAAAIGLHAPGRHVYVCGPQGFIDHVLATAHDCGWPEDAVHYERFAADVDKGGAAFTVVAAKSAVEIPVADGQTIAQALALAGIDVPLSCEQGVCGTCVTPVLEGRPDHRDFYLMDSEKAANDCMTVCCSRSLTARLVLDI